MHSLDRRSADVLARDLAYLGQQRTCIPVGRPALPEAQRALHEHRLDLAAVGRLSGRDLIEVLERELDQRCTARMSSATS